MPQASERKRVGWIDTAKTVSILLVVLYHARHLSYLLDWKETISITLYWEAISTFFKPLRMPLFFLVSGFLASSSLKMNWNEVARSRVYRMYYVYAVWAFIFAHTIPMFPSPVWSPERVINRLLIAPGGVSLGWYIWALATFFLFGWATRNVHAAIPVAIAAIAAVSAVFFEGSIPVQQTSMLRCLLFFIVGLRMPRLPLQVAALSSGGMLALLFVTFCMTLAVSASAGSTFNPVVDSLAVALGIMAAKLATDRWPGFAAFGAAFASNTLPIYLLHFPILVAVLLVTKAALPTSALANYAVALTFPFAATAASAMISIGLSRVLLALGANWLFDLPRASRALSMQRT